MRKKKRLYCPRQTLGRFYEYKSCISKEGLFLLVLCIDHTAAPLRPKTRTPRVQDEAQPMPLL